MSTHPLRLDYISKLGHSVFESGTYNLNIIGLRTRDSDSNTFNDRICVVYKDDKGWITRTWPCTTDPGLYWRENPGNVDGTAILVPGQYRGAYKIGRHRGQYDALVQRGGPVKVYRDGNKNEVLDMDPDTEQEGFFGINIHKAGTNSSNVDKWSAGCQVFKSQDDFDSFMDICRKQVSVNGWKTFTYTLVQT